MSAERYTFDTNVLFYALDPNPSAKHRIAEQLISNSDPDRAVLLLQTLGELCNAVRKRQPSLVADADEWVLQSAVFFDVVPAISADLAVALRAQQQHHLPFWDAMLWATAQRAGCTLLLTEDFQHRRELGGVRFLNPFLLSAEDLAAVLG